MSERRAQGSNTRRAAWTLLALLATAIYAPFLANARPYHLRAIDAGALRSTAATLAPLALEWRETLVAGERAQASDAALTALELRFAALERHLEPRSELVEQVEQARASTRAAQELSRGGGAAAADSANAACAQVESLALSVSNALGERGAQLTSPWRASTSWPLLESLDLWAWWLALLWPLGAFALTRRVPARVAAGAVLATFLAAFALERAFEPPRAFATRDAKLALERGDMQAEAVVFAPVPYGFDETHLSEAWRPPTWLASAELDAHGRRARSGAAGAEGPASRPVEVRPGEPERNAWNRHLCGTDSLGRDVLARVLWGGRVSLSVAFGALAGLLLLGVAAGLVAGAARGWVDSAFLAVVQTLQSFPSLFLILVAVALLPARGVHPQLATAVVIAGVSWTGVARLVRAQVRDVRDAEWVAAARGGGLSETRVLWLHIAPNVLAPAVVSGAFALGGAILAESATSFLGFGVQAPVPSWGAVLRESGAVEHLWILLAPGVLVFAAVAAANALGDALRARLDLREEDGAR